MYLNLIIDFYIVVFLLFQSMAVGNPAKIVGYTEKEDPSLTMKHGKNIFRDFYKLGLLGYMIYNARILALCYHFSDRMQMQGEIILSTLPSDSDD